MSFKCDLCLKTFTTKRNLNYHLNKKVCTKTSKTCQLCGYTFKNNRLLEYHRTHNVCTEEKLKINTPELEDVNKTLIENPRTTNSITIVPPEFLKLDNYRQISRQFPNLLHIALSKHPADFISYLIKETNCNPSLPLYNSIIITNRKDNFAQISDGKKYVYSTKKSSIERLIENKKSILREYVDNNGDIYSEKTLKRYQNYIDQLDENKEIKKELEIDIMCMLLNISDLIGSDEWSKKLFGDLKEYENNPS